MPREDWADNAADKILRPEGLWPFDPGELRTVLDVGCGLSLKSQFLDIPVRVGVDVFPEYLARIDAKVPYVPVTADVRMLGALFPPKSFDLVLALDIIEHVEWDESNALLASFDKLARKAIVLATPNGFVPQDIDIWGHGGDHWQTHRCGWSPEGLQALGYHTVLRSYRMQDTKRHTSKAVAPEVTMIHAIKFTEAR
jgi:2-polyprenyl-3-methyl-5-hydroxy-6-metoxy-1,4-benzoquinol methylase